MPGLKLGKEAQAKFDEAKNHPDYSGMLDKKGAKRKNWNNRWFVLKDNYLFYCKSKTANPQGIINLHGCTITTVDSSATSRPNSFSVLATKSVSVDAKWTNRTYLMSAKTEEECSKWMKVLKEAGQRAAEKTGKTPASDDKKKKDDTSSEESDDKKKKKKV